MNLVKICLCRIRI